MSWTRDQTSELISLYKKYPQIYNAKHENYQDRRIREESFNKIQEKLCVIRKNTTVKDIKAKVKTIRNQYYKERNLINKSYKLGELHIPKLWFYFDIRFIDPENSAGADNNDNSEKSSDTFDFDYIDCSMDYNNDISNDKKLNYEKLNEKILTQEHLNEDTLNFDVLTNEISNDEVSNDEISNDEISNDEYKDSVNSSKVNKTKSNSLDLLEKNCQKSLILSQQLAGKFKKFNRQPSHLYYFMKSIETDLLALPNHLQHQAKWKIQDIVREVQREHFKKVYGSKKRNLETVNNETLQKDIITPTLKHSNIQIKPNVISNLKTDVKQSELKTNSINMTKNSTPQIGKPKIYHVLKPIPKYNSTSNFPLKNISSTLILGEKFIPTKPIKDHFEDD